MWNDSSKRQQLIAQQDLAWKNLGDKLARWDEHAKEQWPETRPMSFKGTVKDVLPSQVKLPEQIQEEDDRSWQKYSGGDEYPRELVQNTPTS